jgi:hypothetical protein
MFDAVWIDKENELTSGYLRVGSVVYTWIFGDLGLSFLFDSEGEQRVKMY